MTRTEFLKKAEQKCKVIILSHRDSDNGLLKENCIIKDVTIINKFLNEFSFIRLIQDTTRKNDKISKNIFLNSSGSYWEDIGTEAVKIAHMCNISHKNINFYMSVSGLFYTEKHEKIADSTDEFLEYFLNVPCDYHEPPSERTYKLLRDAGWYEGRKIDISGLVKECEKDGVFLTDKQKEFISEFGNINAGKVSVETEKDNGCYEPHYFSGLFSADTISVGYYKTVLRIYLSGDGRLYDDMGEPFGLDAMEAFHIMLND